MNPILKCMEEKLCPEDARELAGIFSPKAVMTPPIDTRCGICAMPDGEIRYYGFDKKARRDYSTPIYWASQDCGLSWKKYTVHGKQQHASAMQSPYSKRYISVVEAGENDAIEAMTGLAISDRSGLYAALSDSPASTDFRLIQISKEHIACMYLPIALRHRRRIVCAAHLWKSECLTPIVLFSDDEGENWSIRKLQRAPRHEARWPHGHCRWQNYSAEPTVAELSDGTLLLLARTSLDVLYQYRSYDGGDTWTEPEPSIFHATLTSPTLLTLSDGRLMLFWCNTQPLPEMRPENMWPPLREGEISGDGGEDFFTNRDACHAAISEDDGRTWIGFREVWLNGIRNRSDYRSLGGCDDTVDKSVHQFQALELPGKKILLSFGQHPKARQAVIFDVNWLYETERTEDFSKGLENVSTHVYVRSVPGNLRGVSGHCSLNRMPGAILMPDPNGNYEEALFLSVVEDPRLISPLQGMVWNFPATSNGNLCMDMRVQGEGVRVSLTDRWGNPTDETVRYWTQYSIEILSGMMGNGEWTRLKWVWSGNRIQLYRDGEFLLEEQMRNAAPYGLCYLHVQTISRHSDALGTWIKRIKMHSAKTSEKNERQ